MSDPTSTVRPSFAHLHLHSEYSALDGANRVEDIVTRCKALGMSAVAVTDHGNMSAAPQFVQAAKKAGIKPILGIEAYVAHDIQGLPVARTERNAPGEAAKVKTFGHHLVLLAETPHGLQNLFALTSDSFIHGFYGAPRTDRQTLEAHHEGVIAINGHLGSSIAHHLEQHLQTGDEVHLAYAREEAEWNKRTFGMNAKGEPCFFLELQRYDESHLPPEAVRQSQINPLILQLARELDIPVVCDNDAHFLTADAWDAHDTLCCISTKTTKTDRDLRYSKDLYIKSPEEMATLFADLPEALENTVKIANRCHATLSATATPPLVAPQFRSRLLAALEAGSSPSQQVTMFASPCPAGSSVWLGDLCSEIQINPVLDDATSQDAVRAKCDQALRLLAEAGLVWRYGNDVTPAIRERLDRELGILSSKKISAYFLIVWDFVSHARAQGILCTARGSGVGTMTGYTLGLSNACPDKHGLLFERFTDPEREAYPDIDIDVCKDGRQQIIQYVREKYEHVAQISAFARLGAKGVLRDVGRVMDIPLPMVDRLCKWVGNQPEVTLESTLKDVPEFASAYRANPQARQLVDTALQLEGLVRHRSIHAAGILIANRPLQEICPLASSPTNPQEGVFAQWEGPDCEKAGLLKMDILGVKTLDVIKLAKELIHRDFTAGQIQERLGLPADFAGDPLDLERLDGNDQRVLDLYQRGDTDGIFQFESGGMRKTLVAMRPGRLEDLIAAVALYRPGPMDNIPSYAARKRGQERIPQIHPEVDAILAETHGVMVYQEQIMQILHRVGGIPLRRAYEVIKAVSKKKEQEIGKAKAEFLAGALSNGVTDERSQRIFADILRFANYGFNKSHAAGYAIVSYWTAWLKTYFPAQFMAALLTFEASDGDDKLAAHIAACRTLRLPTGGKGVEVKLPDINASGDGFSTQRETDGRDSILLGLGGIKGVGDKAMAAIMAERDRGGEFKHVKDFVDRLKGHGVGKAVLEALIKGGAFDRFLAPGEPRSTLLGVSRWTPLQQLAVEKKVLGLYLSAHPTDMLAQGLRFFGTCTPGGLASAKVGATVMVVNGV